MSRAQAVVVRGERVLMVHHVEQKSDNWCLPGGHIGPGEPPADAVLRELAEECGVRGRIVRKVSEVNYGPDDNSHTFLVDIGDQSPKLGRDPELAQDGQILADVQWLRLEEICERDRAFLWSAGLITVEPFGKTVLGWGDDVNTPRGRGAHA